MKQVLLFVLLAIGATTTNASPFDYGEAIFSNPEIAATVAESDLETFKAEMPYQCITITVTSPKGDYVMLINKEQKCEGTGSFEQIHTLKKVSKYYMYYTCNNEFNEQVEATISIYGYCSKRNRDISFLKTRNGSVSFTQFLNAAGIQSLQMKEDEIKEALHCFVTV